MIIMEHVWRCEPGHPPTVGVCLVKVEGSATYIRDHNSVVAVLCVVVREQVGHEASGQGYSQEGPYRDIIEPDTTLSYPPLYYLVLCLF